MAEPSLVPRFQRRTEPYDTDRDGKRIRNAHRRRHERFKSELDKMDQNHPGSYGLTIIKPELGYNRYNMSGSLRGFEDTAAFHQFMADMHAYATKRIARYYFQSSERYATGSDTVSELISRYTSGAHTRDALRKFFTALSKLDGYQPSWKASHLTLDIMKAELVVVAELPLIGSTEIWEVLVQISSKIKDSSDLLYLVQINDAISRQRNEPLPPRYPFEQISAGDTPSNPVSDNSSVTDASIDRRPQTDLEDVRASSHGNGMLANMPVEEPDNMYTADGDQQEHMQIQLMELQQAGMDVEITEGTQNSSGIFANMLVENQQEVNTAAMQAHHSATDTPIDQQDALLTQIMTAWPENEDAEEWDERMEDFLAAIINIENRIHNPVSAPLREWKNSFERLKMQAWATNHMCQPYEIDTNDWYRLHY